MISGSLFLISLCAVSIGLFFHDENRRNSNRKLINKYLSETFADYFEVKGHTTEQITRSLDSAILTQIIEENYDALVHDFQTGVKHDSYGIEINSDWLKTLTKINENITLPSMKNHRIELLSLCKFNSKEKDEITSTIEPINELIKDFDQYFRVTYDHKLGINKSH